MRSAELREKMTDWLTDLESQARHDTDVWQQMLDYIATFPQRSPNNNLLIYLQNPEATLCYGYRQWQQRGRQVRGGEKAMYILAPIIRKDDQTNEERVVAFKGVGVFDIEQTTVFDQALWDKHKGELPQYRHEDEYADWDEAFFKLGMALKRKHQIEMTYRPLDPATFGYITTKHPIRITLNELIRGKQESLGVLIHEAAHYLAGHDTPAELGQEWLAESVSYIVLRTLGLQNLVSGAYLHLYQLPPGALTELAPDIASTAHKILTMIGDINLWHKGTPDAAHSEESTTQSNTSNPTLIPTYSETVSVPAIGS